MGTFIEKWKQKAAKLEVDTYALYLAYWNPRVSLWARFFVACVVGYAFSPIDLILDFIPVLGYLDDLVLIPLGIKLAISMIPDEVMAESRKKAQEIIRHGKPVNQIAAIIIVLLWILFALLIFASIWKHYFTSL